MRQALGMVLVLAILGTACSDGDSTMTATLTSADCTYDGPENVSAGPASISFLNDTGNLAGFDLHRISETNTYADLVTYIAGEQQSLDEGTAPQGPPPWSTITETVLYFETAEEKTAAEADGVAAFLMGEEGAVDTTLSAGTYAVICLDFAGPAGARLTSIRVAGPFEATGS